MADSGLKGGKYFFSAGWETYVVMLEGSGVLSNHNYMVVAFEPWFLKRSGANGISMRRWWLGKVVIC